MDIEQFATLLRQSGLIGGDEVQRILAAYIDGCRDQRKEATVDDFCDFLIETERLTLWQCDKLRMGKWKGFYLDDYVLLEQVGKDYDSSSYKARDTRDDEYVCLVITPVNRTSGRIEFRVEPYIK